MSILFKRINRRLPKNNRGTIMSEQLYRIRRKSDNLHMHGNQLSWSERGTYIKSLQEAQNEAYWHKLNKEEYEIVEYSLTEEKIYEIS